MYSFRSAADTLPAAQAPLTPHDPRDRNVIPVLWKGRSGKRRDDGVEVLLAQRSRDDHFQDSPALPRWHSLSGQQALTKNRSSELAEPTVTMYEQRQWIQAPPIYLWANCFVASFATGVQGAHSASFGHSRHYANAHRERRSPNPRVRHVHRAASTLVGFACADHLKLIKVGAGVLCYTAFPRRGRRLVGEQHTPLGQHGDRSLNCGMWKRGCSQSPLSRCHCR